MFLSTKGRYAVMSLLEVASFGDGVAVQLSKIAQKQNISITYLEKIFSNLKKADIVSSVKGPGGGYIFQNKDITVLDVINASGEEIKMTRCEGSGCMPNGAVCKAHKIWEGIEKNMSSYLSSLKIVDIASDRTKIRGSNFTINTTCSVDKDIVQLQNCTYLDNNATTKQLPEVIEEMEKCLSQPMNPSSTHAYGRYAKRIIDKARRDILNAIGAGDNYNLIFTSSGTEANNIAINSFKKCFVSKIEHSSVLHHPKSISCLPVLQNGQVDLVALKDIISKMDSDILISVMMANNETGVIQPISDILNLCSLNGVRMHTDAVQCIGKIEFNLSKFPIDIVSISAHKFGGPPGVGAIIYKKDIDILPIMFGGHQEYKLRPGTHNTAAICGFGVAATMLDNIITKYKAVEVIRDYIEHKISLAAGDNVIIFGKDSLRLPNTLSIGMKHSSSEAQLIHFDMEGIMVSSGSACSSGAIRIPYVQAAMGYDESIANSAIRVSLSPSNSIADADKFISAWIKMYKRFSY